MNVIEYVLHDPKAAVAVIVSTTGTGISQAIEWIPDEIGKATMLVSCILSLVLIYNHWRNGRAKYAKIQLEMQLLKRQLRENAVHTAIDS